MSTEIPAPIVRMLGLARRARGVTMGLRATVRALERGTIGLVLLASDASPRTGAEVRRASGTVRVVVAGTMEQLGGAIGTAPVAVVGVRRGALAAQIGRLVPHEGGRR